MTTTSRRGARRPARSATRPARPPAGESLTPLLVTPAEPAVPFAGSNGKILVSYELRLANVTPLALSPTRVSVSTPAGKAIDKLGRAQVAAALAMAGARSGVRRLTEGSRRRST